MRVLSRLAVATIALFLSTAPTLTLAQASGTTGGGTGTTTSGTAGTTTGAAGSADNGAPAQSNGLSTTNSTTTANTTTSNSTMPTGINWTWLIAGAVVLVVVIGLVAMTNGRTRTTTTIRRD